MAGGYAAPAVANDLPICYSRADVNRDEFRP